MKCSKCNEEATMDVPKDLCKHHWKLWWYGEVFDGVTEQRFKNSNPSKEEQYYFKLLKDHKKEIKMKPIPCYGDLFTIREWEESCESGCLIDYDGSGHFATETECSNIRVYPSYYGTSKYEEAKKDFTHIVWYNR